MKKHIVAAACAAALLSACGGGGGTPTPTSNISGTAAAGAPVIGTVTVKDSTGATRTSTIAANGSYRVDVTGMTGPFVFMAEGTVAGRSIRMVSAATSADVDKTINITPFTDLIVANIAGQVATNFFASPNFAQLTAAQLDTARRLLTDRLLPILTSLNLDPTTFDLLRTSFATDHTGFDAVMDTVRVTTSGTTATITDVVNNQQIQDDLASPIDNSTLPAPAAPLNSTAEALRGIEQTLAEFSAAFATELPATNNAALRALMSPDMLDWGGGVDGFLSADGVLNAGMVGVRQSGVSIVAISNAGATMDVEFASVRKTAGSPGTTTDQWQHQFRKNSQGKWQYAGNRRWAYAEATSVNSRFPTSPQPNQSWDYRPYLGTWVTTRNTQARYALLTGPGLADWAPPSLPQFSRPGLVFGRNAGNTSSFQGYSTNGVAESTWIPDCATPYAQNSFEVTCINMTNVSAGSTYTVTLLDANGAPIGTAETFTLKVKPYTTAESAAAGDAWFGRVTTFDPATLAGLTDGKRIRYTLTAPTTAGYGLTKADLNTPNRFLEGDVSGTTVDVGVWSGAAPTSAGATLTARDASNRKFVSFYDIR